jgi:hypothetical protein
MAISTPAVNAARPRLHLHRSTYVLLVLVSAVLFLALVPGTRHTSRTHPALESYHGWPMTYLVREKGYAGGRPTEPISIWQFGGVTEFRFLSLVVDVLVALCILVAVVALAEWRVRRRPWFKISLREVFALILVLSLGFAWLANAMNEHHHTQALLSLQVGTMIYEGGPHWLRDLLPPRYRILDRITKINEVGTRVGLAVLTEHKAALRQLREVGFYRAPGCGEFLPLLNGLRGPIEIGIVNTPVSDQDLDHFKRLQKYSCIWLKATKVTPKAVADFRVNRPDISVVYFATPYIEPGSEADPFR